MTLLLDLTTRPYRHSYSSLKMFKQCPAMYAYAHIMKLKQESTGAMDRGTRLHKLCEDYMKAPDAACPYDIRKIGLKIFQLREKGAKAEETWLLDKDWNPTDDPASAKIKAIVDVHVPLKDNVLVLHDYKSGRVYDEHNHQLEFYGLIGLRRFPDAKRVEASAIYIDSGGESPRRSILREMFPHYARPWQNLIEQLDSERQFVPTPNANCKRCAFRSDQGGPCGEWARAAQ